MRSSINKNKAFTLLEAILAIFVTLVGVLAAYGLVQQILSYISISSSRFTAVYLAKEGIEIVRNIRDTNWIEGEAWDNDLWGGDWQADYASQTINNNYDGGDFLNIDANGLYSYFPGTATKFKRKISIVPIVLPESMIVSVQVEWEEDSIISQEILYRWWE